MCPTRGHRDSAFWRGWAARGICPEQDPRFRLRATATVLSGQRGLRVVGAAALTVD